MKGKRSDLIDYCGCCGRGIKSRSKRFITLWCDKCEKHVLPDFGPYGYRAIDERTYFAQHRKECPFQIGKEKV